MDLFIKKSSSSTTTSSSTGYLVWVIFGVIVALAAGFFLFTFIRDRKKKKQIREEKIRMKILSENAQLEIVLEINNLIEYSNKMLEEFVPSIGKLKMSMINEIPKDFLKKLIESKKYIKYVKTQEDFIEFKNNTESLFKNKANTWAKVCEKELEFFKTKKADIEMNEKLKQFDEENRVELEKIYSIREK